MTKRSGHKILSLASGEHIVAMVVYRGQLIIATTEHIYQRGDDGKFKPMEFVAVADNNEGQNHDRPNHTA